MLLVVARLFQRLAGDGGQRGVAGLREAFPHQLQEGRDHGVAQHREGEVAARQLDQGQVQVVAFVAQKGQLVFVMALAVQRGGVGQQGA